MADDNDRLYFMWDERLSEGEVRHQLARGSPARRVALMAKIMRDARVSDVWHYVTPADIAAYHAQLFAQLGWHKPLWVFLYNKWIENGLLKAEPYIDAGPRRLS